MHARQEDGCSREEQELERREKNGLLSSCASGKTNFFPEVPFHFPLPCHGSVAQEHRHRQGWSWLDWQHKPQLRTRVNYTHVHPTRQSKTGDPSPLGRLQVKGRTWLSSPWGLRSCDMKPRIGTKSSTATEMLQGTMQPFCSQPRGNLPVPGDSLYHKVYYGLKSANETWAY